MSAIQFGAVSVYFGEKSGKYPDGNLVIVQGADMRVSFDTPLVANRVGKAFDEVDLVILGHVHEDHMAGLHRVPKARVQVHSADLHAAQSWDGLAAHYGYEQVVLAALLPMIQDDFNYQPRPDATAYKSDATWDLGGGVRVRAHHLPGHTSGHCALVVESEGVAFIGDIDLTGFGPYYGDRTSSLPAFRRSLAELPFLDAKVWVTSHHRGVLRDRTEFLGHLDRFRSSLDQRNEKLLEYLAEGPQTLQQLVDRRLIYPPGYKGAPYIEAAERRTIRQHIDELKAAGLVDADRETYSLA